MDGQLLTYALDLNAGLTQVLEDGTNSYLYGIDRLAQTSAADEYFLGDALNSVRQLADASGEVTLARAYEPYGSLAAVANVARGDPGSAVGGVRRPAPSMKAP